MAVCISTDTDADGHGSVSFPSSRSKRNAVATAVMRVWVPSWSNIS